MATDTYTAGGQRTAKDVDGTETKFIWDDKNILLETDSGDTTQVVSTLEPLKYGNVISERRKDGAVWTPSYFQFDALGSTRNLTISDETVTDTWLYDAWGNIVSHTGTSETPSLWIGEVGYYFDVETGNFSVRARVYDPVIGRWRSVDPLGFIDGPNPYAYAQNNPVTLVDMTGMLVGWLNFVERGGSFGACAGDCINHRGLW